MSAHIKRIYAGEEDLSLVYSCLKTAERSVLRRALSGETKKANDDTHAAELRAMGLLKGWALTELGRKIAPRCHVEKKNKNRAPDLRRGRKRSGGGGVSENALLRTLGSPLHVHDRCDSTAGRLDMRLLRGARTVEEAAS